MAQGWSNLSKSVKSPRIWPQNMCESFHRHQNAHKGLLLYHKTFSEFMIVFKKPINDCFVALDTIVTPRTYKKYPKSDPGNTTI